MGGQDGPADLPERGKVTMHPCLEAKAEQEAWIKRGP